MIRTGLVTAAILTMSNIALATHGPQPQPEDATVKGDCQEVDVVYNEELKQLEYDFYDYEAFTDINQGISRVRAGCTVKVPVKVPHGYKVAVSAAILEYAGFVAEGGQGHTSIRYRLAGQSSEGITKSFPQGPLSDEDTRIVFVPEQLRYSACGEDVELELKSYITVRAPIDGHEDTDVSFEAGFSTFKEKYFGNKDYDFAHKFHYEKC